MRLETAPLYIEAVRFNGAGFDEMPGWLASALATPPGQVGSVLVMPGGKPVAAVWRFALPKPGPASRRYFRTEAAVESHCAAHVGDWIVLDVCRISAWQDARVKTCYQAVTGR